MDIINISSITDNSGETPITVLSNPVTTVVNDPTPCGCCRCCRCCRCACRCRCRRCCRCQTDECDRCSD